MLAAWTRALLEPVAKVLRHAAIFTAQRLEPSSSRERAGPALRRLRCAAHHTRRCAKTGSRSQLYCIDAFRSALFMRSEQGCTCVERESAVTFGIRRACVMRMPRGDKSKYTEKQKRKAEHIEDSYESRGLPKEEAEGRAWATVNKESGGGNLSGSGRGVPDTSTSSKRGGRIGGERSRARPATQRRASAKKAAVTRKRRQSATGKKTATSRKRKASTSRSAASDTKRAKRSSASGTSATRAPSTKRSSVRRGAPGTRLATKRRTKKAASAREAGAERQH